MEKSANRSAMRSGNVSSPNARGPKAECIANGTESIMVFDIGETGGGRLGDTVPRASTDAKSGCLLCAPLASIAPGGHPGCRLLPVRRREGLRRSCSQKFWISCGISNLRARSVRSFVSKALSITVPRLAIMLISKHDRIPITSSTSSRCSVYSLSDGERWNISRQRII